MTMNFQEEQCAGFLVGDTHILTMVNTLYSLYNVKIIIKNYYKINTNVFNRTFYVKIPTNYRIVMLF